jgi:hypothetical protein
MDADLKAKKNWTRSKSEYSPVMAICYGDHDSGQEYSLVIDDPNKIWK